MELAGDSATLTFAGSSATYANSITRPVPIAVTNPSTGNTINPMSSEAWQKMVAANMTDDGEPQWYYFDAGVMKFGPRPASTDTLTMRYLQRQSDVTSASVEADVLLPPDYHWLPILLVVSRLSARDDDVELAQFYMNKESEFSPPITRRRSCVTHRGSVRVWEDIQKVRAEYDRLRNES